MKQIIFLTLIFITLITCNQSTNQRLKEANYNSLSPVSSWDTTVITGMKWRNIGPNRGGRSLAVAGSPSRKNEYYFGAVGGGLWKTTDGGTTWKPVTDGQIKSSSVGAVAVSPSNPDIVYIGMGESALRGNIMQGDGVYKSIDGGKTWQHMGLENTQTIAKIRIHPRNPNIVYVAALGHPYGQNKDRGVFKSVNGGKTWKKVLYKSDKAGAVDLVIDIKNPNTLYASIWEVYRTPYKMWGGGGDCGLFKSTDGGASWTNLTDNKGMPKAPIGKIGVAVSPANSQRVWAVVEANEGGVFRSDNAGKTWTRVNDERKLRQRAFYYSHIVADPKDANTVYALNVGFYKSTDGGKTFDVKINPPHGDNHDLWIDPNDPQRMINANDGGGTVSLNGGKTWTDLDFPTAQLYHISITNDFPYHVTGAQQDNSTMSIPSEGWGFKQAGGPHKQYYYPVGGGESGYIAQDPKDLDVFFAGSQGALLTVFNRKTGYRRDVQVYPRFFSGDPASDLPERWQWTFPIVFSPVDNKRLYTCSQHVWYSQDNGQSWAKISPDLTYADPKTLGKTGGIITMDMNGPEIYATVFALAPSYFDVNTIWAGSDDGKVHITRDHGKNWQEITPPDMPKDTRVSIIDASRHDPATAYIAAKRYQMNDRTPYIWKTHDYGQTWEKIVTGIRADDFIHTVREDIVRPGLLFAGGEHQVWTSFDDGENWHSLQLNMPDAQISDLFVTEKDVVVGTHGRSIYILDDIEPIRAYSAEVAQNDWTLFKPYYAVRRVQNATIQYFLKDSVDEVKVEILDAKGNVIVSKSGDKTKLEKKVYKAGDRYEAYKAPTTAQGLNSWTWNLRYPGAEDFEGMIIWSARPQVGPLALPGTYQVRLTVNNQQQTHSFEVKQDPRTVGISQDVLKKQFAFATKIKNATDLANKTVIRIREIKEQLNTEIENSTDEAQSQEKKEILKRLSTIEETLYQVKNRSGQDPLNFPIRLNNRLAYLRKSVESGDGLPTAGARKVFSELKKELDEQVKLFDEVEKSME